MLKRQNKLDKRISSKPEALLLAHFALVILIGWMLLMLPWSSIPGKVTTLDALFTSTSAVCVTGLITVDTATVYTRTGQFIIVCLIQIGGLGLMTFSALIFRLARRRISYSSQIIIEDTFFQDSVAVQFKTLFKQIVLLTAFFETIGALSLFLFLPTYEHGFRRAFSAVFHSVSAFCNAGFSIYTENLVYVRSSRVVLTTIMLLIICGGIGYSVLTETWNRTTNKKYRQLRVNWSLHSRVVIRTTLLLIFGGALVLFILGFTQDENTLGENVYASFFQSVTARTAGFNSVNIGGLGNASLVVIIFLMFIGGSPGGTAGGIKTSTAAVIYAVIISGIRKKENVSMLERRIPPEVIQRAVVVITLSILLNVLGVFILSISERGTGNSFIQLLFEQISAFGTVGLSAGVTPTLSSLGKIWIILTMYIGRVGPLTVALWFTEPERVKIKYPYERIMIG
jgi:trk system potassium uptake protein TrkH